MSPAVPHKHDVEISPERLPAAIREADRWLLWKSEERGGRHLTKVPYQPGRPSRRADPTNESHRTSFDTAWRDYEAGACTGIGFALGDGFVGVDLDKCRDSETGEIEPWALKIAERLDSYTEISPSGTGLHVLLTGRLPTGRRREGKIEMYSEARYFTVTGNHLEGTPLTIEARTAALATLHAQVFNREKGTDRPSATVGARGYAHLNDEALLELAQSASNGPKMKALWEGIIPDDKSASEADFALCSILSFWTGGDVERIDRLFRQSGLMRVKWDRQDYRDRTIAAANARPWVTRPTVLIRDQLNPVTDEATAALAARPDLGVYVRGRMLVTVARDGSPREGWIRRPPGAPVIVPIGKDRMLGLLDEAARWEAKRKTGAIVPQRPPLWVAQQVLSRVEWPLPYLEGVVEAPTLRTDGSILATPGFDEPTGLLFEPDPRTEWPTVPDAPTQDQVAAAIHTILDPVQGFPFVARTDKAAFVAAVLSILIRHLIDGPVPGFAIRAPTPGTGKSLLADVIGIVGTGRVPAAMSITDQSDEFRKRVLALAIDGSPLVLLENLSGSVGSDVLAGALTATEWRDRLLGRSEIVTAPLSVVWLMTGNNLTFQRTLGRRVIPIDLDARIETPEDRSGFRYADLRTHALASRSSLAVAALTIARAFYLAGRPVHGGVPMGSFEAWDNLIRSMVIWAGLGDPATTEEGMGRSRIRGRGDDDLDALGLLLETLRELYPKREPFSTLNVLQKAIDDPDLQLALDMVAAPPKGGRANAHSLGRKLGAEKDRPLNGLVLRQMNRTWIVCAINPGGEDIHEIPEPNPDF